MTLTEQQLEDLFVAKLVDLKYTHREDIRDRAALEDNFRKHFEALNRVRLTDGEFARLLEEITTPDVFAAAKTLRSVNAFTRDDGTPLNYTLVNIDDWCKNTFEVVSQLRINTDYSHHRYDVLLLINGVPVTQIELKTLGINPRRAIEQIVEYKNDPGNGYTRTLLCFVQLFIVSNRDSTYYFANNNARHFAFNADERFLPIYEFAKPDNTKVKGLDEFAALFLAKCTLGHTISRYMVLVASEQKLLMMRPYQVYAVKNIVECIKENRGNGYVWHTTGSGKTLTSFKASTLLKADPNIHKCLFVVDRKDLDRQTREEFNKFQEKCVEENTNTAALVERLLSDDAADKVIVCTIQKLGRALDATRFDYRDQLLSLRDKRMDAAARRRAAAWQGGSKGRIAHGKVQVSEAGSVLPSLPPTLPANLPPTLSATPSLREGALNARRSKEIVYGDRIHCRGMAHAPVNEQGVVLLFGMLAAKLGFEIEMVRTGYPDCEAKRQGKDGKWRRVMIEFEFATSRFDHDPAGCDLIVCWEDDNNKSGLEVLELKRFVRGAGDVAVAAEAKG